MIPVVHVFLLLLVFLVQTEHLIKEMFENIGKIRQNRETNSSSVKEQKRIIQDEIQKLRTKVNNHLDKLQENQMKELIELEKQVTEETRELLVSLDEKHKKLIEYQTNIVNIKKYASELQTFIAVKQIEKDVETHDTCLQSLVNSYSLNQTKRGIFNINCIISKGSCFIFTYLE
jgi:vacuolar-type H+-ATPase subunit I/STV1